MKYKKIGYIVSKKIDSKTIISALKAHFVDIVDASNDHDVDLLIVLGGDGFMIQTIHEFLDKNVEIYGINCGNLGFLLNEFSSTDISSKISSAFALKLMLLKVEVTFLDGSKIITDAVNETYILRKSHKATCVKVTVNDEIKIAQFVGDGIIISTPVGSSAYNYSAGGAILPFDSNLINMTPINPFRPKKFSSIILPDDTKIKLEALDPHERPIIAVVDFHTFENVVEILVYKKNNKSVTLLFDSNKSLAKKIIDEQFLSS